MSIMAKTMLNESGMSKEERKRQSLNGIFSIVTCYMLLQLTERVHVITLGNNKMHLQNLIVLLFSENLCARNMVMSKENTGAWGLK